MPEYQFWDGEQGTPPHLQHLVGRVISFCGQLKKGIFLRFDSTILIATKGDFVGPEIAVIFEIGEIKEGSPLHEVEDDPKVSNEYTKSIIGRKFTGLSGNTITFDDKYGFSFGEQVWVRRKGLDENPK